MKKNIVLMLTLFPIPVFAQAERGNGGDPNELASFVTQSGVYLDSWYGVKTDLIKGLELGRQSELNFRDGQTAESFSVSFAHALKTAKVEFDDIEVNVDDETRPCENYSDQNGVGRIHCNLKRYKAAMSGYSSETEYKMVAHEYMGITKLESNRFGVSDYFYSNQISSSLRTVNVKRWAVLLQTKCVSGLVQNAYSTPYPQQFCADIINQNNGSVQLSNISPNIMVHDPAETFSTGRANAKKICEYFGLNSLVEFTNKLSAQDALNLSGAHAGSEASPATVYGNWNPFSSSLGNRVKTVSNKILSEVTCNP